MIDRLRDLMTSVFPGLERAFDYASHKGAHVLLTGHASPHRLRRVGHTRLAAWLCHRKVRDSAGVAARAITAARAQMTVLPAWTSVSGASTPRSLRPSANTQAAIIQSMPGFGPLLGASLLVGVGDLRAFPGAGHLAAAAGLVPVPNDSGRRTGNLHRPKRYNRPLRHVFYFSAQTGLDHRGSAIDELGAPRIWGVR
jgi:hypothetical protein